MALDSFLTALVYEMPTLGTFSTPPVISNLQ
jgi:hypothetical protein